MNSIEELPVPAKYLKESQEFSVIWNDYIDRREDAISKIIKMINILESNGYTRTQAIEKIKSDHKHLKGFSRATIYRELPDNMKRKYERSDIIMLPEDSNVSNETFENSGKSITENDNNKPKVQLSELASKEANKIKQQLDAKIDLVAKNHNRFKEDPKIEKILIKEIADPSISVENAKVKIAQEASDLETGAIIKHNNTYIMNFGKREKVEKKPERVKHHLEYFLQFQGKTFPEMMYILTGHKLNEDETFYEPNHVDSTEKHRQDMVNELDERQKNLLYENAEVLFDAVSSLMDIINGGSTTKL